MKPTIKRFVLFGLILSAALLLSGCEALLELLGGTPVGLTASERVSAFLADANLATRDGDALSALQSHFHPNTAEGVLMDTTDYWDLTFWIAEDQPFDVAGLVDGGEDTEFPGSVTMTGSVTNANTVTTSYPITFVLLQDSSDDTNWLIRKIAVDLGSGNISEIKKIQ